MSYYPSLPKCSEYHPQSELKNLSGYYPNISADQLKAANSLKALLEQDGINVDYDDGEEEFLKLLRFLRARKFNVQNAYKMLTEDHKWRLQENRLSLRRESATTVLGCDNDKLSQLYKYFPTWIQGTDKQLRPVSYRQFGKFEIWNVLKLTTLESLVRFHAWETEQALRLMRKQKDATGYNIETFVLVIDAAGWNMKLATNDAFAFIKGMAVTDSDHYPERLGTMIIINAPSVLSFAWRIIQGFLDPVTKEKINILGSYQEEWKPVLLKYIDIDQIPHQYGGTAPDPAGADAINSMNPPETPEGGVEDDETVERLAHSSDTSPTKNLKGILKNGRNKTLTTSNSTDSTGIQSVTSTSTVSSQGTQTDDFVVDHMIGSPEEGTPTDGGVFGGVLKSFSSFRW